MKRLAIIPLLIIFLQVSAQEKLIQYNSYYLKNTTIQELTFNRKSSDLGPCIVGDKLFFTALNSNDTENSEKTDSPEYYQLYSVNIDKNGDVTSIRHKITDLEAEYNIGPNSYDEVHSELMITRNNIAEESEKTKKTNRKKRAITLEMVSAVKDNGLWKFDTEFTHNDINYSVGHPAYTPSGDTLIYVSNMPDGFGESDLYMSIRLDDGWSYPKNLGAGINTKGKEFTPFVTQDRILIFASNGLEEDSDFDLYYTSLDNLLNPTLVKFPEPINSDDDDFGMVISKDHRFGYFSSNRPGTGSDDIYKINFNLPMISISGKVINKITKSSLADVHIQLSPEGQQVQTTKTNIDGTFSLNLEEEKPFLIKASKQGFVSESKSIAEVQNVIFELSPENKLVLLLLDSETEQPVKNVSVQFNEKEVLMTGTDGIINKILDIGKTYSIKVIDPEYLANSFQISADGSRGIINKTLSILKLKVGNQYHLENLQFEDGKWDILSSTAKELDSFSKMVEENKNKSFELTCIPDSKENIDYKSWLANKRLNSIYTYLTKDKNNTNNILIKEFDVNSADPMLISPGIGKEHIQKTVFTINDFKLAQKSQAHQTNQQNIKEQEPVKNINQQTYKNQNTDSNNQSKLKIAGTNYRIQFYASKKPININSAMSEIVENFSQYGLINQEEDFLIKYQIGPFTDMENATSIYNRIKNMGYQVMLLEYRDNNRQKMILPNGN